MAPGHFMRKTQSIMVVQGPSDPGLLQLTIMFRYLILSPGRLQQTYTLMQEPLYPTQGKVLQQCMQNPVPLATLYTVSYTHLRAHETGRNLVCRLLLEKKKKK